MRRLRLGMVTVVCALMVAQSVSEAGYVRGYTRRDGTYVRGYYRGGGGGSSSSSAPSVSSTAFSSCTDAHASGYSNMTVGSAGYSSSLDRDGDGVACESGSGGGSSMASAGSGSGSLGSTAPTTSRPGAALRGTAYFRARDLQEMGGVISKLGSTTYELVAFGHTVNVIPNSVVIINDGQQMKMAAAPVMYQNSLYIPAQYLYKFGCDLKLADTVMVLAECPNYRMFSSNATAVW